MPLDLPLAESTPATTAADRLTTASFDVSEALTCASCVATIEGAVSTLDGIDAVHVSIATDRVTVTYDPAATSAGALIDVMSLAGYKATERQPDTDPGAEADARDAARAAEIRTLTGRVLLAAIFTLPVFVPMMSAELFNVMVGPDALMNRWVQAALTVPVMFIAGWPLHRMGWASIVRRSPDMNALITLGTSAAFLWSLAVTAGVDIEGSATGVYWEAVGVIITLILLGRLIETKAKASTGRALRELLDLRPATAVVRTEVGDEEIDLADVQVEMLVVVKPGSTIPVDGTVVEGSSTVDESMLTGESVPVQRSEGDTVAQATMNTTGALVVRADAVGADTVLANIIRLVDEAQASRANIQRTADAVAARFVPAVVVIAVLTFATWWALGTLGQAIVAAVAVLIIACPCALGLATPLSIRVGTGIAARSGILFRSAEVLETLGSIDHAVLDKTGTVTTGTPALTDIVTTLPDIDETRLLQLVASVEALSEHPLASAIERDARDRGIDQLAASGFMSMTGGGVSAKVDGRHVGIGNRSFAESLGADVDGLADTADGLATQGRTPMFVVIDGSAAGLVATADTIRPSAAAVVAALRSRDIEVTMLTGDDAQVARAIAADAGIATVIAQAAPEDKSAHVQSLRDAGHTVAMVGDGINDAPALATADVGVAMRTGTDVAMQTAQVTLGPGALDGLVEAVDLSRATMRNIRQNLVFAFAYNIVLIPLAAGVFAPITGWQLSPMIAAAAMAASSISVVANANRLRRFRADALPSGALHSSAADISVEVPQQTRATEPTHRDPVCGMDVTASGAAASITYDGEDIHFCAMGCRDAFVRDPEAFGAHSQPDMSHMGGSV